MDGTLEAKQTQTKKSRFDSALADSCTELRGLEKHLFAGDRCSPAGLLVAQLRLDLIRLEDGVAFTRTDILCLLTVASRVTDRTEVGHA